MPLERRLEWEAFRKISDARDRRTKVEAYLDRGYGSCKLRNTEIALLTENTLLFHDAERYRLCAWVIMPNHVHALFEVWKTPMSQILYTWKRFSATKANRILNGRGRFWQKEYWDRYIRDEEHFNRARKYIESNPVKAGLCCHAEEWAWSSANPKWDWELGRYVGHLKSKNWDKFLSRGP